MERNKNAMSLMLAPRSSLYYGENVAPMPFYYKLKLLFSYVKGNYVTDKSLREWLKNLIYKDDIHKVGEILEEYNVKLKDHESIIDFLGVDNVENRIKEIHPDRHIDNQDASTEAFQTVVQVANSIKDKDIFKYLKAKSKDERDKLSTNIGLERSLAEAAALHSQEIAKSVAHRINQAHLTLRAAKSVTDGLRALHKPLPQNIFNALRGFTYVLRLYFGIHWVSKSITLIEILLQLRSDKTIVKIKEFLEKHDWILPWIMAEFMYVYMNSAIHGRIQSCATGKSLMLLPVSYSLYTALSSIIMNPEQLQNPQQHLMEIFFELWSICSPMLYSLIWMAVPTLTLYFVRNLSLLNHFILQDPRLLLSVVLMPVFFAQDVKEYFMSAILAVKDYFSKDENPKLESDFAWDIFNKFALQDYFSNWQTKYKIAINNVLSDRHTSSIRYKLKLLTECPSSKYLDSKHDFIGELKKEFDNRQIQELQAKIEKQKQAMSEFQKEKQKQEFLKWSKKRGSTQSDSATIEKFYEWYKHNRDPNKENEEFIEWLNKKQENTHEEEIKLPLKQVKELKEWETRYKNAYNDGLCEEQESNTQSDFNAKLYNYVLEPIIQDWYKEKLRSNIIKFQAPYNYCIETKNYDKLPGEQNKDQKHFYCTNIEARLLHHLTVSTKGEILDWTNDLEKTSSSDIQPPAPEIDVEQVNLCIVHNNEFDPKLPGINDQEKLYNICFDSDINETKNGCKYTKKISTDGSDIIGEITYGFLNENGDCLYD